MKIKFLKQDHCFDSGAYIEIPCQQVKSIECTDGSITEGELTITLVDELTTYTTYGAIQFIPQ